MIMLRTRAKKILIVWYSALSDNIVVIEPAPAIRGKAIGKMDPPPVESCLKSSIQDHFHGYEKNDK